MFKVLRIVKLAVRLLRRRSRTQKQQGRKDGDGGEGHGPASDEQRP